MDKGTYSRTQLHIDGHRRGRGETIDVRQRGHFRLPFSLYDREQTNGHREIEMELMYMLGQIRGTL